MELYPAEDMQQPDGRTLSGVILKFPSGATKQVAWCTGAPIEPTLDAAKSYAAAVIEHLSSKALYDDMERTNWASAVAAFQKVIMDFNARLKQRLYAESPAQIPHSELLQ